MKNFTIELMTTEETFAIYQTKEMKKEYEKELEHVNIDDICSIQKFLDNSAQDIERLTQSQCELFDLNYEDGYYISTWHNEYLKQA